MKNQIQTIQDPKTGIVYALCSIPGAMIAAERGLLWLRSLVFRRDKPAGERRP